VSIWVCDNPTRLDELGYYLEAHTKSGWKRLPPPEGRYFGDLPPQFLEIGENRTDSVPASVNPELFGVKRTSTLRLVVRAWHTERNAIGYLGRVDKEPILLTSAPFILRPKSH
jgi:hypothetical protein